MLTRVEFLRGALGRLRLPPAAVGDILSAHRDKTVRQYECGWRKFQSFVRSVGIRVMTASVPIKFASFVFHSGPRVSAATVANALFAIKDPLWFGFGVVVDQRAWTLLRASFFLQRPTPRPSRGLWSLPKVLRLLE